MTPTGRAALGIAAMAASIVFLWMNLPARSGTVVANDEKPRCKVAELVYMGATHTFSYLGFNQQGHVSGSLWGPDGRYVAALFDGKKIIPLGTLKGDNGSRVYGMNDSDMVVGGSYKYDNLYWMRTTRGFVSDGKSMRELPPLKGLPCSRAWSVNNKGLVVGNSYKPLNEQRDAISLPVVWEDGKAAQLPLPEGATDGIAYSVNDNGDIAGNVTLKDGTTRACRWHAGKPDVLSPLNDDKSTTACAINGQGVVLAASSGTKTTVVVWDGAKSNPIEGVPGVSKLQPVAINDSGAFIANDPDTPGYPYLWEPGKGYVRISRLIGSRSGYSLWKGLGLNNRGQIAVGGRFGGTRSSVFLVSPS